MSAASTTDPVTKARQIINRSDRIVALTGAGISAESGVPTFRGQEGLWNHFRAEDLATPQAFSANPELVWEWYNWRRGLMADKIPNPGHSALAELEQQKTLTLITQNVDGLHALAGNRNLLELHGNIWRVRCVDCGLKYQDRRVPLPFPPLCDKCGCLLRPDVVWFGEALDSKILGQALSAAQSAQVMLVIGTSALVHPAASLAWQARSSGAYVIEINIEATPFSSEADLVLNGPSGRILRLILTTRGNARPGEALSGLKT